MASILDMVSQGFLANNQAPDIGGAISKGAELAQHVQNIQSQRAQIEQAKAQLELTKWDRVGQLSEMVSKIPEGPARQQYQQKIYPAAMDSLVGDKIHPLVKGIMQKDPDAGAYIYQQVKNGEKTAAEGQQIMGDPELMGQVMASPGFSKFKAQKDLAALPQSRELQDQLSSEAKSKIITSLETGKSGGGITPAELYAAQTDPAARAALVNKLGLANLGGEETLKDVFRTYPNALEVSAKVGIQHDASSRDAALKTETFGDRVVNNLYTSTVSDLTKPSSIPQKKLGAYQSISNAYNAFKASGNMGQEFEQLQTQLRLNQGATGGRTGVNERAKAHASDLGMSTAQYIQIATGNVQDVDKSSPGIVKAIEDVAAIELNQISKQGRQAIDTTSAGHRKMLQKYPQALDAYNATVKNLKDQFVAPEGLSPSDTKTFTLRGRKITGAKLKGILNANPAFRSDPEVAPLLKELGVEQ